MIKSLQEQLISSGLIDKKKANKIYSEQRKANRKNHGPAAFEKNAGENLSKASRADAERYRELNRQLQMRSEQKAVAAQIRQIVQANRLPKEEGGDTTFNFAVRGKVKKIYTDRDTRERICTGNLAIVEVDGKYELIPSNLVEKLRARNENCIVFFNNPETDAEPAEDGYSDYKIPDNLIW